MLSHSIGCKYFQFATQIFNLGTFFFHRYYFWHEKPCWVSANSPLCQRFLWFAPPDLGWQQEVSHSNCQPGSDTGCSLCFYTWPRKIPHPIPTYTHTHAHVHMRREKLKTSGWVVQLCIFTPTDQQRKNCITKWQKWHFTRSDIGKQSH